MKTTGRIEYGIEDQNCREIDDVLLALDAEADALPAAVVWRLAESRQQILQANAIRGRRGQLKPESPATRLLDFVETLRNCRPVTGSLAASCMAVLAGILVFNTMTQLRDPSGNAGRAEPSTSMTIGNGAAFAKNSLDEPIVFEPLQQSSSPAFVSTDSLKLVGSVEFLLWLDAQQG